MRKISTDKREKAKFEITHITPHSVDSFFSILLNLFNLVVPVLCGHTKFTIIKHKNTFVDTINLRRKKERKLHRTHVL